jgi:hypothetical protein
MCLAGFGAAQAAEDTGARKSAPERESPGEADGQVTGAPRAQVFEEVERGFFLRSTFGAAMVVTDMFADDGAMTRENSLVPGPLVSLELGYDLGQIASLHLAGQYQQLAGVQSRAGNTTSADVTAFSLMLGGRINLITTQRLGWYFKAGAGWMFAWPGLAGVEQGFMVQGGTGLEYATKLRHFFLGLEVVGQYDIANGGVVVGLAPTLKYVF